LEAKTSAIGIEVVWNKIPDSINISDVKLDGAHEQLDMLEDDMVESNKHYAQTRKPPNW